MELDGLGATLTHAEGAVDDLSLIVQALTKDWRTAREQVEQSVKSLADPNQQSGGESCVMN